MRNRQFMSYQQFNHKTLVGAENILPSDSWSSFGSIFSKINSSFSFV